MVKKHFFLTLILFAVGCKGKQSYHDKYKMYSDSAGYYLNRSTAIDSIMMDEITNNRPHADQEFEDSLAIGRYYNLLWKRYSDSTMKYFNLDIAELTKNNISNIKKDSAVSSDTVNSSGKGDIESLEASSASSIPISAWNYSDEEDKMTSKKIYFASIDANDQLYLRAPYDGGVTATLTIRRRNGENNAYISVSKGQFITHLLDGQPVKIRFDSTRAETYYCSPASDGDSRILFINSANRAIARLKKAKKVIVEAELYDNGYQEIEFNTAGFKWDY